MSKTRPCALCARRPRAANLSNPDLCPACYDYAGWENTHSDEGHDDFDVDGDDSHAVRESIAETMTVCPICLHVPPPWTITEELPVKNVAKTRVNPTTSHMSHASCSHPRTPKGRAECRKLVRAGLTPEGRSHDGVKLVKVTHVRLGKSKTVHFPGACPTTRKHDGAIERTDDALTCKVCLKVTAPVPV